MLGLSIGLGLTRVNGSGGLPPLPAGSEYLFRQNKITNVKDNLFRKNKITNAVEYLCRVDK